MSLRRLLCVLLVACGPAGGAKNNPDDPPMIDPTMPTGPIGPTTGMETPEPTEVVTSVGTAGGKVRLGQLTLTFPPNAVTQAVSVRITRAPYVLTGYNVYSDLYVFEPEDLQLQSDIIVELPFEAEGADARLFFSRADDPTQYEELPGIVVGAVFKAIVRRFGHGFVGSKVIEQVDLQPPNAPSGVVAHAGDTEIDVTWPPVQTATSYRVIGSTKKGGPYSSLEVLTTTKFTHMGLDNGKTYYYRVVASNADGISPQSEEAEATPAPVEAPSIDAVAGNAQIRVEWIPPEHASTNTRYLVYRDEEGPTGPVAFNAPSGSVSYVDGPLTNGVLYTYWVKAVGPAPSGATSPTSNLDTTFSTAPVDGTTFAAVTGAQCPTNLTPVAGVYGASGCDSCAYNVTWDAPDAQATHYKVQIDYDGNPLQSAVNDVADPEAGYICSYRHPQNYDTVTITVRTCYANSDDRCNTFLDGGSFTFPVRDLQMLGTCTQDDQAGVLTTCPYPEP